MFLAFPTRQYYWDGVLFALNIERAATEGIAPLIHPNHLVFNVLGFGLYWPLHAAFQSVRALPVLQGLNIAASAATALVLGTMLRTLGCRPYLAAMLTGVFVFGASWWKFSVDADAYIVAAFFLLLAARALLIPGKRPLLKAAVFHCAAMLIHQLGVLFLPAVWTSIALAPAKEGSNRMRRALAYTAGTGIFTLSAYYWGFALSDAREHSLSFLSWIRSHSADSAFTIRPGYIAAGTLKSYVQLLFGGRIRLFLEFFHWWMVLPVALLVGALIALAVTIFRSRTEIAQRAPVMMRRAFSLPAFRIALAWTLSYAIFLLFWLPRNTFYKLLLWPALILCCGCALAGSQTWMPGRRRALTLWLTVQCCWNFLFFVYPYSKAASNPVLGFAQAAAKVWSPGETILFRTFDTDNWTIRYFTPRTVWKSLDCQAAGCLAEIDSERSREEVWLDPTAIHFLETATPETKAWLRNVIAAGDTAECCGSQWPLHFLRLPKR